MSQALSLSPFQCSNWKFEKNKTSENMNETMSDILPNREINKKNLSFICLHINQEDHLITKFAFFTYGRTFLFFFFSRRLYFWLRKLNFIFPLLLLLFNAVQLQWRITHHFQECRVCLFVCVLILCIETMKYITSRALYRFHHKQMRFTSLNKWWHTSVCIRNPVMDDNRFLLTCWQW